MSPVDWFYAVGNKQSGPVPPTELKRLAAAGELKPDDLVWREGLAEWTAARNVRGLFDEAAHPAATESLHGQPGGGAALADGAAQPAAGAQSPPEPAAVERQPARHPIDALLAGLRSDSTARFVVAAGRLLRACGRYGLLAAMVLAAVFAGVTATTGNVLHNVFFGVLFILWLAVMQYASGRLCDALERLNRASAGRLQSTAVADCLALLSFLGGLACLLWSVAAAIDASAYQLILLGIADFVAASLMALAMLNPGVMSVAISADETAPGEEALELLLFLGKSAAQVVPAAFGAGVLAGSIMLGWAYGELFFSGETQCALTTALLATATLTASAALPLLACLAFLPWCLLIELCRAVRRGNDDKRPTV